MSAVIIDNYTLEKAFAILNLEDFKKYPYYNYEYLKSMEQSVNESFVDFLTAIILWDEVWYYDNCTSAKWKYDISKLPNSSSFENIIYPIDSDMLKEPIFEEVINATHPFLDYLNSYAPDAYPLSKHYFNDGRRVAFYRLLSNVLGINIIFHHSRKCFILQEDISSAFNRLDIFKKIDKELLDYYKYIEEKLGRAYKSFKYPVLYDFIRYSTDNKIDELDAALSLRQDKDIIQFRDEITHLEHIINSGNTQALLTQLKLIEDIAQEVTTKYKRAVNLGEIKLCFTPTISKTIQLNKTFNDNMKIHTTFIRQVINFGVNKRP